MSEFMNGSDVAAVTEVTRVYYDGMMSGDQALLALAFHPRACIVGNENGALYWASLEEFVVECKETADRAGTYEWRIEGLSFEGDTALVRLGNRYAGVWYSDDLSMVRIEGAWRIVHKTFYPHPSS